MHTGNSQVHAISTRRGSRFRAAEAITKTVEEVGLFARRSCEWRSHFIVVIEESQVLVFVCDAGAAAEVSGVGQSVGASD